MIASEDKASTFPQDPTVYRAWGIKNLPDNVEEIVEIDDVITNTCLEIGEEGRVKMPRRAWLRDQAICCC